MSYWQFIWSCIKLVLSAAMYFAGLALLMPAVLLPSLSMLLASAGLMWAGLRLLEQPA
jgi:hypothetical protein